MDFLRIINLQKKYDFSKIVYLIDIIHGFIYSTNEKYFINQKSFDNLFNFINNKEFLKDNIKYFRKNIFIKKYFYLKLLKP